MNFTDRPEVTFHYSAAVDDDIDNFNILNDRLPRAFANMQQDLQPSNPAEASSTTSQRATTLPSSDDELLAEDAYDNAEDSAENAQGVYRIVTR